MYRYNTEVKWRQIESPVLSVFDYNLMGKERQLSTENGHTSKRLFKWHSELMQIEPKKQKMHFQKESKTK